MVGALGRRARQHDGADAGGPLPSPLLAKIATPVADVASARTFFNETWAALPWRTTARARTRGGGAGRRPTRRGVRVHRDAARSRLQRRARRRRARRVPRGARAGRRARRGRRRRHSDARAAHANYTGYDLKGFDRYLDNHVKFSLPSGVALDALRARLDAARLPYSAHTQALGDPAEGSVWAAGVGALAVEWGGLFDYSHFPEGLGEFNWCNASSNCGAGSDGWQVCAPTR